jgi:type IV secretion system protein VirB10
MKVFKAGEGGRATSESPDEGEPREIEGDRGIPSVNRARSVQSRVSSVLALTLMMALGLGLLSWYYARTLTRPRQAQHAAELAAKNHAQGEMALPSLGRLQPPALPAQSVSDSTGRAPDPSAVEQLIGPAPPLPTATVAPVVTPAPDPNSAKSPSELAFERRLAGPAFAHAAQDGAGSGSPQTGPSLVDNPESGMAQRAVGAASDAAAASSGLNTLLRPTLTPAVSASLLPTRRFLLAKGAFIDCTLETAIDSTLPGMTTCITATDTFGADGDVVLLERGTKLVGETRGQVQQGSARIFVLWNEARTPTGVVVPLSSPGTDELGRSGLPGEVNRHFWDRFGAAILLTVVNGAVQGAVNRENSSGSVVVSPSTSGDIATEVLRSTVNVAPTVTKAQGDRIQVFVARDVDFRSVYALKLTAATPSGNAAP